MNLGMVPVLSENGNEMTSINMIKGPLRPFANMNGKHFLMFSYLILCYIETNLMLTIIFVAN